MDRPGTRRPGPRDYASAVVGSIIDVISEIRFAGKLPWLACSRIKGLVGSDVNAVDFVLGHVAVNPLNLGAELVEDTAGCLRDGLKLLQAQLSGDRQFRFDYVFWHDLSCLCSKKVSMAASVCPIRVL